MTDIRRTEHAARLPEAWDALATSYFQRREFLGHAEQYNPCVQRYYELWRGGSLTAGAIVYSLTIDILTFLHVPSPVTMQIIGVPASVAVPGLLGERAHMERLLAHIEDNERGLFLALNLASGSPLRGWVHCRMLPTVLLENRFGSWRGYLDSMRAPHRRRLLGLQARAATLCRHVTDCGAFTPDHYALYRQVRDRAREKLETLTYDFFRALPGQFQLASYYAGDRLVSWTITLENAKSLTYFFGGMDYATNRQHNAYLIGLFQMVKTMFDEGFESLDLGQTAETPKLRFGADLVHKDMHFFHRNGVVRWVLRRAARLLSWRAGVPQFRVFKTRGTAP